MEDANNGDIVDTDNLLSKFKKDRVDIKRLKHDFMDQRYYDMSKKGLAIIVDNNEHFLKDNKRYKIDFPIVRETKELENVLEDLNFVVNIHETKTYKEIKEILKPVVNRSDISCFMFIYLGLCNKHLQIFDLKENFYDPSNVWDGFVGKLYNIPKIFLFQVVKEFVIIGRDETDSADVGGSAPIEPFYILPQTSDFIHLYSISEDNYIANVAKSCWFITTFRKILKQYSDQHHFLDLMTLVNAELRELYAEEQAKDQSIDTQLPTMKSSLTKLLMFKNPKEDISK